MNGSESSERNLLMGKPYVFIKHYMDFILCLMLLMG